MFMTKKVMKIKELDKIMDQKKNLLNSIDNKYKIFTRKF